MRIELALEAEDGEIQENFFKKGREKIRKKFPEFFLALDDVKKAVQKCDSNPRVWVTYFGFEKK